MFKKIIEKLFKKAQKATADDNTVWGSAGSKAIADAVLNTWKDTALDIAEKIDKGIEDVKNEVKETKEEVEKTVKAKKTKSPTTKKRTTKPKK